MVNEEQRTVLAFSQTESLAVLTAPGFGRFDGAFACGEAAPFQDLVPEVHREIVGALRVSNVGDTSNPVRERPQLHFVRLSHAAELSGGARAS